jgi:BirA family transcriptional regulator, biotin operon repressor / biotin---[acetyl-CoA-carboxylase] ligase
MGDGSGHVATRRDDVQAWAESLERVIADEKISIINRVRVLAETASTQDAALRDATGAPGLLVTAGRQTAGRGRLGRAWADTSHLGVAATFVLDARAWTIAHVSLGAGLAAARACERAIRADPGDTAFFGIRWPNDVVERGAGRKLSGVLIESRDGLLLAGIGINVLQQTEDFPEELRARAVSLSAMRAESGVAPALRRIDVLGHLVRELDRALRTDGESLVRAWARHDVLTGRRATFISNGREISGEIMDIDPRAQLRVRIGGGEIIALDALSTSLMHEP